MADPLVTRTAPRQAAAGPLLAAQIRYQLRLLVRNPRAMIMALVIPVLLLALRSSAAHSGPRAAAAVLAGAAVFGLVVTAYVSHAVGLVSSREEGVLRRWRVTPLPTWCFFAGKIVATVLLALASVAVAITAAVALFKVRLAGDAVASLAVTFALGAAACAAVGTAVTAWIPATQSAAPILMITYLPVILFSGGVGSTTGEPHWVNTVLSYFPAQPLIDAATAALRQAGGGLVWISGRDAAVLAAWAVAGVLASAWFFRWDPAGPGTPGRRSPRPAVRRDRRATAAHKMWIMTVQRARVRAVIFDWGGTLTPWHTVDHAALWREVCAAHFAGERAQQHAAAIHAAERELWLAAERDHRSATIDHVFERAGVVPTAAFLASYFQAWEPHTWTDPQARDLFRRLRADGIKIGVLSNTMWPRDMHEQVFGRDGVLGLIDGAVYSSEIDWTKPHPEAFRAAMAAVGVTDPAACVFVGDRPYDDVYGAKQAGMRAVLVPNADVPAFADAEPDAVITRLSDLVPLIDAWQDEAAGR